MATITTRVNAEEKDLIQSYARFFGLSVSDFIRQTVIEKIEDEWDIQVADEAYQNYLENPSDIVLFSDIEKELQV
ncbi:type II toxin-antitoxin system RelB family antitoxin [Peptococcus simiae]|uniref:Type II toxin-antitoxin system RelB family antitoxin n=1 Tax=Peptococcus simiae TaxID=1643805 RepID=A0ABW9GWJ9_9FIRM